MRRLLSSRRELEELQKQIDLIVCDCPSLPDFSGFHPAFARVRQQRLRLHAKRIAAAEAAEEEQKHGDRYLSSTPTSIDRADHNYNSSSSQPHSPIYNDELLKECVRDGDVREPFYLSYDEEHVEYYSLQQAIQLIKEGRTLVGSTFIIPYPPGFPISVPGQVRSLSIQLKD